MSCSECDDRDVFLIWYSELERYSREEYLIRYLLNHFQSLNIVGVFSEVEVEFVSHDNGIDSIDLQAIVVTDQDEIELEIAFVSIED